MKPTGGKPTVWELKAAAQAQYPSFSDIDVTSPGFSIPEYGERVKELMLAMGIPQEPITVSWKDLSCTVPVEPPDAAIKTVISGVGSLVHAIKHGGAKAVLHHGTHLHSAQTHSPDASDKAKLPKTTRVLSSTTGVINPGEMCLVLGPSGSGSSLLLSRVSGRPLGSSVKLDGYVHYNGQDKLGGVVNPTHYIQLVGQRDDHIAQLTVRHTLEFAAACKWPEWMPHVEALRRNDVLLTARMLRIERVLDTIVGNDILRGVSGGERKRTTIAEMLIGMNAGVVVMDNWSKGLDSSTTLSITKSMREFADTSGSPVITSMQAPGTDVYNVFDTVCVLDQGHVIYFGPRSEAENYFKSLGFYRPPQRSVPDFVATVANPEMRDEYLKSAADLSSLKQPPPLTSEEFAERFAQSEFSTQLRAKVDDAEALAPEVEHDVPEALLALARKDSLQKPRHQIKAIGKRQVRYLGATRKNLAAEIMQNLILGSILGSIFWQLPDNAGGAGSRGGIVFLSLLFIGLAALAKIDDRHAEKTVFVKQKDSSFFFSWPFMLTMAFFDIVIEAVRSAVFIVPLYFMAGLSIGSSGQRLLYAILIVTLLSLIMISVTRFLVAAIDDPDAAHGAGGILTILLVLYAGFMKPPSRIQDWLIWIYWMDPIHYVYEAMVLNEYEGLQFSCDPEELLPPNPNIPLEFRVCPVTNGEDYLENNLGVTIDNIFRLYYFIVLIAFFVLFFSMSAVATALAKPSGHAFKLRSQRPEDESLESTIINSTVVDLREEPKGNNRFTFSGVKYTVNDGRKELLAGINGHSLSGRVVLLMGESGAGKSTLLDVCALRKTMKSGTAMEGNVRLNGEPVSKELISHFTGYCEQNDIHMKETTIKRSAFAQWRLLSLGLSSYSDILVKALGSAELKLLTMALEVVADPLVLFLDEPTSGISAYSALVVANALRKIADTGTCVVCTVHQPSREVFNMFDQLLLLKRGGKQVYFGDIGENAATLTTYFESNGANKLVGETNPADWMLDVIADESQNWADIWEGSKEKADLDSELQRFEESDSDGGKHEQFQGVGFGVQLRAVISRLFWRYWRLPEYNFTRVVLMFMIALIVGILFLREIDNTQLGATLAFSALFLTVIPSNLNSQNVIPPTVAGRSVFYRETAAGTYSPLAFHIALGIVELPFTAFATTVFTLVFYFLVGLDSSRFGYFFLAAQLIYYFSVMFGVMLASITPDQALGATIANSVMSVFSVLSGFFIRKEELPVWWRWSTWVNPLYYYLAGLVQNQMNDQPFTCEPSELVRFPFPTTTSFVDCGDIPLPGPGEPYGSVVVNNELFCTFCPVPNGEVLIQSFGADDVNKWVSLVAIVVAILICRIVAGIGFLKLRFLSR
ncbi:ABC-2 type transporter [Gracilaria domingensis]|nr:ABC-2 type transporter [Gracilaria domingensis]